MEHIAVEWVVYAELDLPTNNYLIEEAKEMEKQQQGYSEEDLKEAFKDAYAIGFRTSIFDVNLKQENCDEWFELFKNK